MVAIVKNGKPGRHSRVGQRSQLTCAMGQLGISLSPEDTLQEIWLTSYNLHRLLHRLLGVGQTQLSFLEVQRLLLGLLS